MSKTNYYLQSGTVLEGRYQIEEVIGEGGFGITYKGVHKTIGLPVAIKEFFSKDIMIRNTLESNNVQLTWEENEKKFEKEKKRFLKERLVTATRSWKDSAEISSFRSMLPVRPSSRHATWSLLNHLMNSTLSRA